MATHSIIPAFAPEHLASARRLFEEYQRALGVDLCFQGFAEELESLEQVYGPPRGALLLVEADSESVGCVGLRDIGGDMAEMKRMYVRPSFRGKGIGRELLVQFIATARRLGYAAIRLDSLRRLTAALSLYRSAGFVEIAAYRPNPEPDIVYLELRLR